VLHTQAGLSHGKAAAVFDALFGVDLTRGASAQINLRAATRLEPDYQLILDEVRGSEQIAADETGWRIGGHPAWLHAWVGEIMPETRRRSALPSQVLRAFRPSDRWHSQCLAGMETFAALSCPCACRVAQPSPPGPRTLSS